MEGTGVHNLAIASFKLDDLSQPYLGAQSRTGVGDVRPSDLIETSCFDSCYHVDTGTDISSYYFLNSSSSKIPPLCDSWYHCITNFSYMPS